MFNTTYANNSPHDTLPHAATNKLRWTATVVVLKTNQSRQLLMRANIFVSGRARKDAALSISIFSQTHNLTVGFKSPDTLEDAQKH